MCWVHATVDAPGLISYILSCLSAVWIAVQSEVRTLEDKTLDLVQVSSSICYVCFSGGAGAVGDAGDVESAPSVSGDWQVTNVWGDVITSLLGWVLIVLAINILHYCLSSLFFFSDTIVWQWRIGISGQESRWKLLKGYRGKERSWTITPSPESETDTI